MLFRKTFIKFISHPSVEYNALTEKKALFPCLKWMHENAALLYLYQTKVSWLKIESLSQK